MCPLYPFHVVLLYLCLLLPLLLAVVQGAEEIASAIGTSPNQLRNSKKSRWNLSFHPTAANKIEEQSSAVIRLSCNNCDLADDDPDDWKNLKLHLSSNDPEVASVEYEQFKEIDADGAVSEIVLDLGLHGFDKKKNWAFDFNITGQFLGFATISAEVKEDNGNVVAEKGIKTSIVRKKTIQSKVFAYSVAVLVSLAYINMGCALDLQVVKETVKKPIGPVIGFLCQYVAMPLLSFGLGFLFYLGSEGSATAAMRLGLFVTGCSPGGGASNIWTVMFGGNLDLSVTMTAISTFAAFFMMPAWIFTLGQVIFNTDEVDIVIPYYKICTYAIFLIVPLGIGLLISKYLPRTSAFLVRILKPLSLFLILFIIIFGIWANLYIFRLMTWPVLVTGMALPWLGFGMGCTLARVFRRPFEDVIAIAIETGVQNTGIAIFILWFTLDHPLGDMTAVVPVAVATMTPFPLLGALIIRKIFLCCNKYEDKPGRVSECPVIRAAANLGAIEEGDLKDSESSQKLMAEKDFKDDGTVAT